MIVIRDARRFRHLLTILGAILTGAVCAIELRDGVYLSPDGWEYWESSISLARGCGYTYLGGHLIRVYPPLFPVYLAIVQSILGVSGASLFVASVLLAIAAGGAWCGLVARVAGGTGAPRTLAIAGAAFVVAYLGWRHWFLLSELLMTPLLGLLLLALLGLRPVKSSAVPPGLDHEAMRRVGAVMLCLLVMLLTRNAAAAFVPGVAIVIGLRLLPLGRTRAIATTGAAIGSTLAAWWGVRWALDLGGHSLRFGGKYDASTYLEQLFDGLARHFGSEPWGWLILGAIVALGVVQQWAIRSLRLRSEGDGDPTRPETAAADGFHLFVLAGVSAASLFAMFNLTWINDELKGRFILFVPLIMMLAVVASASWLRGYAGHAHPGLRDRASTAIITLTALAQIAMAIDLMTPGWPGNVDMTQTLAATPEIGLVRLVDAPTLVDPSEPMSWIDDRRGGSLMRMRSVTGCEAPADPHHWP